MIKAVVMDMDGTLLSSENTILPETKSFLLELQKKGVKLILASGRSYTRLLPYAHELQMDRFGGYLIEVDGIAVYEPQTHVRNKFRMMEPEEIREIFSWLMETGAEVQAMFDDGVFDYIPPYLYEIKKELRLQLGLDEEHPWTAGPWGWLTDYRNGYPNISYIKDAGEINLPVNKIQVMDEEDRLAELFQKLQKTFGDRFSVFRTAPRQLEILPYGYSKGAALQNLMDQNGWNPEEVAAFGDGENDVSLFETAGHSFAMKNAREYVQEKARYVTDSNNENGIMSGLVRLDLPK